MYLINISIFFLLGVSAAQGAATNESQAYIKPDLKSISGFIIGGTTVTDRTKYPYHASIQLIQGSTHLCSASLIDDEHLVSSARCLHDFVTDINGNPGESGFVLRQAENLQVVLGTLRLGDTTNRLARAVKYIFIHEDWSPTTFKNDIAVIRIAEEIKEFTNLVDDIDLASWPPTTGTACVSSGWSGDSSSTNNPELKEVSFTAMARADCTTAASTPSQSEFCGRTDGVTATCQGEWGSPVVCNGELSGMISMASSCTTSSNLIMDISHFKNWIEDQQERSGSNSLMHSIYLTSLCILTWVYILQALVN